MDFDEKLEEWFIPQLPISQNNKRQMEEYAENHNKLAMGFNEFNDYNDSKYFILNA